MTLGGVSYAEPSYCGGRDVDADIEAVIKGTSPNVGPAPAAALVVMRDGETLYAGAAGCAQIGKSGACNEPMTANTKFRAASVSKMATAFIALSLANVSVLSLDADISDYYDFPIRNPAYPATPITLRHLLSHMSSIRDPDAYWIAAPGTLQSWVKENQHRFMAGAGAPGDYFTYANLNYGLAAGVLEIASGDRFDKLAAKHLSTALGLDVGFNWSGVSREARARGATLYRFVDNQWTPQVDGVSVLDEAGAQILLEDGLDREAYLRAYRPGDNPTLFSPQGGLRASVVDLAELVGELAPGARFQEAAAPAWMFKPSESNGETNDGLYTQYGLGTHRVKLDGRAFIGHAGEAYGLLSGAWLTDDEETALAISYVVTGTPVDVVPRVDSGLTKTEETLLSLALKVADCAATQDESDSQK